MSDDLSPDYLAVSQGRADAQGLQELVDWAKHFEAGDKAETAPFVDALPPPEKIEGRPLPEPKPVRAKTDDQHGRVDPTKSSTAGTVMRNLGEVLPQAAAGVDQAVHNALSFIDPLANWLDENVIDTRYTPIAQPKTATGAVTRKLSEFLTGFIPALKGLRTLGMTGNVAPPMIAGAIADFSVRDPHEGRLADLWKEAKLPENVLTEYLASDPTDSGAEARFKNAAEGVLTGAALEALVVGARALRGARKVGAARKAEEAILREKYGELTDADFAKFIGDPSKPGIQVRVKRPSEAAGKVTESAEEVAGMQRVEGRAFVRSRKADAPTPEDFDVYINFAKFDEPKEVQFAIGKMADLFKGQVDEARRGVITHQETQRLADEMGLTVTELLERNKGEAFNAETALAARQLWAASGEKLVAAAKAAAAPNASPLDQFVFRKMMAVHNAIQKEVIGARTEAARALNSWKIPANGIERARAIEQITSAMGGPNASKEMARRLAILAEANANPAAIARFAEKGWGEASMDALKEVWVNGLLSSPKTHAVNITSNMLVAFQQIYERGAAAGISRFTGNDGVVAGEATAMAFGMVESVKDAFRMAAQALKTGETGWAFNKVDFPRPNSVSAEAFRMSKETGMGRFVDFLGTATRVPSRLLGAEDEFFKTIGYRMELRAQALRQATQEGHRGEAAALRIQELLDNPPPHLRINAADAALYNTFTNDVGWFGRNVMNLREGSHLNPTTFVLPFVRTPVNIARYAFERSPFAPLVGQWRADIAAGGARQDLALARMSTGTAIMMMALDWADSGLISGAGPKGSEDKDLREALSRQGWQPFSMKVGDRWYSYNRTDPFGMTMGLAATIAEAVRKGEIDEDDVDEWYEVSAMAIAAVAQTTISKTYLEGLAKVVEVMSDPKRYSQSYIQELTASFIPATSLSSAVKGAVDPVMREANTPWEAVMARVAVLSERLPPRRNLWGEELRAESQLGKVYDFVSPVQSRKVEVAPVDREIVRLGGGPNRIQKKSVFDGVDVNMKFYPQVYDEYTRLAGNELKHSAWGVGAKDFLNSVVSGAHPMSAAYRIMSDETRRDFIRSTVSDYRQLAQRQILRDPKHRNFANEVERLKAIHQTYRMPVLESP